MESKIVREFFLNYFKERNHRIVPSSSLVPAQDPTLLFTNAGMNQFKEVFLGIEEREYKRATTCQKCLRAGGKHNDLENVGFTPRHHTFFEMLGNFSFGDYFKKEAIEFAWELSVKYYKISPDKIWVSVFEKDDEAYNIWHKIIGMPENKIIRLGEKDNFWAMGDIGPCGPCSELLFDLGEGAGCGKPDCTPEHDCGRFLEFWNLVFMEFSRDEKGTLKKLPKPSIDTGAGLERVTSILQKVKSNYETDLFLPIIDKIYKISNYKYGKDTEKDIAVRVLADHTRAVSFLISDGILPSNEGRGYVLRRIIRRAQRFGKNLNIKPPIIGRIYEEVKKIYEDIYPEIREREKEIKEISLSEEEKFERTLEIGLEKLDELFQRYKGDIIPGEEAFVLYDTFGIPYDFIEEISREKGFKIEKDGFDKELENQRKRSKIFQKFAPSYKEIYEKLSREIQVEFFGYENLNCLGTLKAIIKDNNLINYLNEGEEAELIFDKTTFYGESGGQVGDKGLIEGNGALFEVKDTLKNLNLIIHKGKLTKGVLKVGERYNLSVDKNLRKATERNHTGTHLLHYALRKILGKSVRQMGSLVEPERLRFDFAYQRQLTEEEIKKIEEEILEVILMDKKVNKEFLPIEEAKKRGALAFFEEKYGEIVRVVSIEEISSEFCGGTHLNTTGEIGILKIIKESSISAGVRRIEAITGFSALKEFQRKIEEIKEIKEELEVEEEKIIEKIRDLKEKNKELQKKLKKLYKEGTKNYILEKFGEINFIRQEVEDMTIEEMRSMVDEYKNKIKESVILVYKKEENKGIFVIGVTKNIQNKIKASDLAKEFGKILGGSGGGNPSMAQAGGKNLEKIEEGINFIKEFIKKEEK